MEVENAHFRDSTHLPGYSVFHFHDYGRKGTYIFIQCLLFQCETCFLATKSSAKQPNPPTSTRTFWQSCLWHDIGSWHTLGAVSLGAFGIGIIWGKFPYRKSWTKTIPGPLRNPISQWISKTNICCFSLNICWREHLDYWICWGQTGIIPLV